MKIHNLFNEEVEVTSSFFQEENVTNNKIRMNKETSYYFMSETLTAEEKKLLIKEFKPRLKVNVKKVEFGTNYSSIKEFRNNCSVQSKMSEELKAVVAELNKLEINSKDWFNKLTDNTKKAINKAFKKKYVDDISLDVARKKGNEKISKMIDEKIEIVTEFAIKTFDDTMYDFEKQRLKTDVLNKISNGQKVVNIERLVNRLIVYAVDEEKYDMLKVDDESKNVVGLSDWAYEKYVKNLDRFPYTKREIKKQSLNRTIDKFKGLAMANAHLFSNFITLTFADIKDKEKHLELNKEKEMFDFIYVNNVYDYQNCMKFFSQFLKNIKKKLQKLDIEFYYLGVCELQKNGRIHFHLVTSELPKEVLYDVPKWLDYDYYEETDNNGVGINLWKYGKSDVQAIQDKARVTTYISKYMYKTFNETFGSQVELSGRNRYYCSKNLIKPESRTYAVDTASLLKPKEYVDIYQREVNYGDNGYILELYQLNDFGDNEKEKLTDESYSYM